ncbi:acyltransferase [Nocardioides guangzhouensis]|uniref:Acyltransferase n=1 Tax=Nocardioides guangzhouensis TaxID=2497878 RepID=A0A4Q4ZH82_9ACTN|nr:acyltransferase family protein [Nocardioides guangzhouensis]RYP87570.1 acyltransferase [Nocardioides guangzhouensis]
MRSQTRICDLVATTPADRNRAVDLVRASAVLAVVAGHWLMAVLWLDEDGGVRRSSLLGLATWTHPLTWLFQVMPLVFVVGGFANALSWRHAVAAGTPYAAWLRHRLQRLVGPLVPLLVLWLLLPGLLRLGTSARALRIADRASLVPLWFIATYVVVVALVPATLALWDRIGLWSVLAGAAVVVAVDVASLAAGLPLVAAVNALVVWATLHQLGYAWLDGRVAGVPRRLLLTAAGLAVLVVLTHLGPYATSMVGVRGPEIGNTAPPRTTLVGLGVAQAGVAMLLEPLLGRVARVRPVWAATVAVNARIMTLYLWHLTAVGLVALGVPGTPLAALLEVPYGTAGWWWSRFWWFALVGTVTAGLVLALGRFEHPAGPPGAAPPVVVPLLGVTATCVGLALLAWRGVVWPDGSVHREVVVGLLVLLPLLGLVTWSPRGRLRGRSGALPDAGEALGSAG